MSDEQSRGEVLLRNRSLLVMHSTRTAAHELNNVFQMIGGSAELLLANPALPAALVPRVDSVVRHVRRGEAIVRAVADLARPEGAGPALVDMGEVAHHALDMRRFEHRRAGLSVTAELQSGALVRIDRRDLVQIVLNALLCAEQAISGQAGGTITLSIAVSTDNVRLSVEDNGEAAASDSCDLEAAGILAAAAGGSLQRSGVRTELTLPAGRPGGA
jgi:C4-dicarboxylate-specific signal transduction histidine kinase